eukprot:4169508-Pyramimonas_sp.AAC.1
MAYTASYSLQHIHRLCNATVVPQWPRIQSAQYKPSVWGPRWQACNGYVWDRASGHWLRRGRTSRKA